MRITAQLIDAGTGHYMWAERYDREFKDIFALQDEIVLKIMRALQLTLSEGQRHSIKGNAPKSLDAYLKLLKGRSYFQRPSPDNNAEARQLFEEAIALDPTYSGAYRTLARTHLRDVWYGWSSIDGGLQDRFLALMMHCPYRASHHVAPESNGPLGRQSKAAGTKV